MTDLSPFYLGVRCAEHVNADDVADKLATAGVRFDGSAAATLLVLGLFVGSASEDVDGLLDALEHDGESGVLGPKEKGK